MKHGKQTWLLAIFIDVVFWNIEILMIITLLAYSLISKVNALQVSYKVQGLK